jgi:hypothetical protein
MSNVEGKPATKALRHKEMKSAAHISCNALLRKAFNPAHRAGVV